MKHLSPFKIMSIIAVLFQLNYTATAQNNCLNNETSASLSWSGVPKFDGLETSKIKLTDVSGPVSDWFNGSFTIDTWIYCDWNFPGNDYYTVFSAGDYYELNNNLAIFIEKDGGGQIIRISDGVNVGSSDLFYSILYDAEFKNKWRHITVTYDNTQLKLYIDGVYATSQAFEFNTTSTDYCNFGSLDETSYTCCGNNNFHGYMTGSRIWTDIAMTNNQVDYVWDKTFTSQESFSASNANLYNNLKVNLYTTTSSISNITNTVIGAGTTVENQGVTLSSANHRGFPAPPSNLTATQNCNDITISWTKSLGHNTSAVYRKLASDGGIGNLLCYTNDASYVDNDVNLLPGTDYTYTIKHLWKNFSGVFYSHDSPSITSSLRKYPQVQNLIITADASSGNCAGEVALQWDPITVITPNFYKVWAKEGTGSWNLIQTGIPNTITTYTHVLAANELGKSFSYRVSGEGDNCFNPSQTISGSGNSACTSVPTGVTSVVNGNNIDLNWNFTQVGAPATEFRISRKLGAGGIYDVLAQNIPIATTSYTDLTAIMCEDYYYKVEAYNSCGAGALSTESNVSTIPMQFNNVFTGELLTSKGYFNNKVTLEWTVNPNKIADISSFEIYRKKTTTSFTLLATLNNQNSTYYEDVTTEANIAYEYLIRAFGDCSGVTSISDSLSDIGFRYSTGIVSGKVTYSGGNAVPDVEVRLSTSEVSFANSLYFDGVDDYLSTTEFNNNFMFYNPISFDTWIKPDLMSNNSRNTIFSINKGILILSVKDMKPYLRLNEKRVNDAPENPKAILQSDSVLTAGNWHHLAFNYEPQSGIIELYLNGDLVETTTIADTNFWGNTSYSGRQDYFGHHGGTSTNGYYQGIIDEARVWQRIRTADEIKEDYTRTLTGKENGLIGYYTFNEGFGEAVYDLSKTGTDFNKNDFALNTTTFPTWTTESPSFEQLHPSGVTDQNGNYSIEGIQYSGTGNIFSLTPVLGVHVFNPTDVSLYIGDANQVQNNVDFIDMSSFQYTGTVYYNNTNFPVEGAKLYIDNQQVFGGNGTPVLTDANGAFNISVPIGPHYISVKKDGHTFLDDGQWPITPTGNQTVLHDFQNDVFGIDFYDMTTVKVAGRFVGGDVEGTKLVGFGKSKNNIGVGTIVFENQQGYDVDFSNAGSNTSSASIITDPASGEYEIELLPEVYNILSVANTSYSMNTNDLGLIDLSTNPQEITLSDTTQTISISGTDTTIVTQIGEYTYDFKRTFTFYEQPEITVYGANEGPFIGENELIIDNPITSLQDTLDLTSNSPFNYPVFLMPKSYPIDIRVNALYYNYDAGDTIVDSVPIYGANVNITNTIEIGEPTHSFSTNEEGKVADYPFFRVGRPNMVQNVGAGTSYTKTISMTAQTPNFAITWNGGAIYRGYTLGAVDAEGANFVTKGVEMPQFILRDPPGSGSYTYLEQESVLSVGRTFSFASGSNSLYDNTMMAGVKFEVGGGLAGPVFESEIQTDYSVGLEKTTYVDNSGSYRKTYRFTQGYSTSSAPNAVGSMADVYIGESSNMFFTETNNLKVLPKSYLVNSGLTHMDSVELAIPTSQYTIGVRSGFAISEADQNTTFIYTQDHILSTLLPTYRDLVYALLATPVYDSKVPATHMLYGMPNEAIIWRDSTTWVNDSLHPSYEFLGDSTQIDSVAYLNEQISVWLQTIAFNEKAKAEASGSYKLIENISLDGTAGAYSNQISQTQASEENKEYFHRITPFFGSASGFEINGTGLITVGETKMNFEQNLSEGSTEEKTMKWGYVLDDSEQGDYYSIDVTMDTIGIITGYNEEFLSSGNYTDAGNNLDGYDISIVGGGAALVIAGLSYLTNPLVGNVLGMGNAIVTSSVYMGQMGHYKREISDSEVNFGLHGASPIFSIQGGQTRCPYEGPELTILYLDSVSAQPFQIHVGTQQHEIPKIVITPAELLNVPADEPGVFTVELTNEGTTGASLNFELMSDQGSNPNGAVMNIDGWGTEHTIFVPAGQTVTKTLTVEKGATSNLDFTDLQLIFHSTCQFDPDDNYPDIADTATFSIYYIPTCTNVEFGNITQNWVANVVSNDTIPVNITGYNINHTSFEKIILQYEQAGNTPTTVMTFFNDTAAYNLFTGPKELINGQADINYNFALNTLNDGDYSLLLKSLCSDGSIRETDHLAGVIDRISPRPFGTPQPADGILDVDDNISIKFNEEINDGDFYAHADYISVKGILNGTDLINQPYILHDASVHFDGINDNLTVSNGINLNSTSFTIEFWAKREILGEECLISLATPSQGGLWFGFDATDKFKVQIGNQTVLSDVTYNNITGQWAHYSVSYFIGDNNTQEAVTAIISSAANTEEKYQQITATSQLSGALTIGLCPESGTTFTGNMHELRIWNYNRDIVDVAPQKSQILSGHEQGLYSLWPLSEAAGLVANDIAFSKNAVMNATWQVSRDGNSIEFDGASYFEFPTTTMAFDEQSDFTVEFWFKHQTAGTDASLFSNGLGTGVLTPNSWNIIANTANQIVILNNGQTITLNATDYLDNNWHHFALVVNRLSNVNVYLDGNLMNTANAIPFGGFGAAKMVVGAEWYYDLGVHNYNKHFTGVIDELRVWNSARKQEQIELYKNYSLTGNEYGLKAYFPFEDVTIADPSVVNSTIDNFTTDTIAVGGNGLFGGNTTYAIEVPSIKLQRPEVEIPFTYVINTDEVIIMPQITPSLIENRVLDISVKQVKDMNNNRMASTVSWTAFVNQNNVVWDATQIFIEKYIDEDTVFTVNAINQGGTPENYTITGLPTWMTATPDLGSLNPLTSQGIDFTIGSSLNIGEYSTDVNLVSSLGYNERFQLNVKVKAHEPNWTVDPAQFQYSTNIIGQLSVNSLISTDIDDKVTCFIDGECRGVANVEYFASGDLYLLFLTVYDNNITGGDMTFKVFDASTGNVYVDVTPQLTFVANDVIGTISSPIPINSTNNIQQQIDVNTGWNWISLNVHNSAYNDLNYALSGVSAIENDFIKQQLSYAQFDSSWVGNLGGLDIEDLYKLKVANTQSIFFSGEIINPDTVAIPVVNGWNWIGYPLTSQLTVDEALSSLTSTNGDIIKSQTQFAMYDNQLGWLGSLDFLTPGNGYMFNSFTTDTIHYPQPLGFKAGQGAMPKLLFDIEVGLYATNMNVVGVISTEEGIIIENGDAIYTFVGDECRGVGFAKLIGDRQLFYITLYSNANNEEVSYKLYTKDGTAFDIIEKSNYIANSISGANTSPTVFTLSESSILENTESLTGIYPNPFNDNITFNISSGRNIVKIEFYNSLGKLLNSTGVNEKESITLNTEEYSAGVYYAKLIQSDGTNTITKLIKTSK